jgi:hypothetical protein
MSTDFVGRGRAHLLKAWVDDVRDILTGKSFLEQALDEVERLRASLALMNAVCAHQANMPRREAFPGIPASNHELTCGNDSRHTLLLPYLDPKDGKVKLVCRDCDYVQAYLPVPVVAAGFAAAVASGSDASGG